MRRHPGPRNYILRNRRRRRGSHLGNAHRRRRDGHRGNGGDPQYDMRLATRRSVPAVYTTA